MKRARLLAIDIGKAGRITIGDSAASEAGVGARGARAFVTDAQTEAICENNRGTRACSLLIAMLVVLKSP
jgi:hypothetical protein